MSWFRRGHGQKPDYTALEIQTSASTLPIPIVYGRNKIAGNILWYANFQAVAGGGGKGSGKGSLTGGGGGAQSYTYKADLIIGVCEGPISGFGIVYKDQSIYFLFQLGLGSFNGTTPQDVWPYLAAEYPANALAYQGTAYVWGAGYNLGDAAAIGNHNFEVIGILAGSGANGEDADPAQVIYDFLTNAQYGCGFNPASISSSALFGTNDASLQAYCNSIGLCFSPTLTSQEPASSVLTRWLQLLNCAAVWSGGELKFIPYGDTAVASGASTTYQNQFSIPTPIPLSTGGVPAFVTLATPTQFVSDGGVVYTENGLGLIFIGANVPSVAGTYGMVTPGTYIFAVGDEGKPVNVTFAAQNLSGYVPNLTPAYALTDLDLVDEKGNKDPLQVERADIFSLPTIQRIEVCSRTNQYTALPVEARDQSQIEIFGPRVGSTITAHEICDEFIVGPLVAQAILQRELYVRTKFTFKLSWEYCLLDPMDIVTLTDANLGLSNYPVRIIEIEEDDNGLLAITAEELVTGVSTPEFYASAGSGNFAPNFAVPSVPVNPPLIFEPPIAATGAAGQIWVGASGASYGTATQWGGANVYVSVDDVTFSQIAVITAPLRQGVLTAELPSTSAAWDTTDALSVDLTESSGTLTGTTMASAQAGATLSLVDNELLAFETATLTGTDAYGLTGLARALGGTTVADHPTGSPFARLDGAVVKYDLPSNLLGQTLYFKFQSFNVFGGGLEDLSTLTVYTFTPAGAGSGGSTGGGSGGSGGGGGGGSGDGAGGGSSDPIAAQLLSGFALDLGSVTAGPTLSDDFGSVTGSPLSIIDLGSVGNNPHPIAAQILAGDSPLNLGMSTTFPTIADNFGSVVDPVVDVLNLGTVP